MDHQNNQILASLPVDALARLQPFMHERHLALRDPIDARGVFPTDIFFPLSGIISVVAGPADHEVEVSVVGCFEMTGASAFLGTKSEYSHSYVQLRGEAIRIAWSDLSPAMDEFPEIRSACLHGAGLLLEQAVGTAWSNAKAPLVERAARWILLCHRRMRSDTLAMTHEFLSVMLGVRRPGVTLALQALEGAGAIRNNRGLIVVRDAALLAELGGMAGDLGNERPPIVTRPRTS